MFGKNATAVTLCPSRGLRWEEQDAAVLTAGRGKSQPFLQALPPTFLLYGVPIALVVVIILWAGTLSLRLQISCFSYTLTHQF